VLKGAAAFVLALCCMAAEAQVLRDLPYMDGAHERQTLDLYLPKSTKPVPLLVFVHGGFWSESDESYGIGKQIAETLVPQGAAVALVRYRLAPFAAHPAQIEDVAAAFAYLSRIAPKHRIDPKRVYVAGHSAGGHLAALLALDNRYLAKYGLDRDAIAGVIGISGIYTLDTAEAASGHRHAVRQVFGMDEATLSSAAPLTYVGGKMPPFLLLNAEKDLQGFLLQARRFADALAAAGGEVDDFVLPKTDHLSVARPRTKGNPLGQFLLWRMQLKPLSARLAALQAARRAWQRPELSTEPFWERHAALIESRPVDQRFLQSLFFIYRQQRYELRAWPLKTYHRIDLLRLLDTLPAEAGGDYVVLRNVLGEAQVWHRNQIETYKPVLVVGLDDEKNLFKLQLFYQMAREYSWRETPAPPLMVLPLGAFVHFEAEPPAHLRPQLWHFSLTAEGISRSAADPLATIRNHPPGLVAALTDVNGCLFCHSLKGVGSRSHHMSATDSQPHGGFALALESYPAAVIDRFLDHQDAVAASMGATPNHVDPSVRESLRSLIRNKP
jgi:arylformamidase